MATAVATRARLVGLDRIRGLAVVLMVVDHALVAFPVAGSVLVRSTATRAALPLFCLVAGALARRLTPERTAKLAAAGLVAGYVGGPFGIGQPDVVLLLLAALAGVHVCRNNYAAQLVLLVVAVIQPVTWPAPWTGYQPGVVIALVAIGTYGDTLDDAGRRLPPLLARVGRYPLSIYLGHLIVLRALWEVFS